MFTHIKTPTHRHIRTHTHTHTQGHESQRGRVSQQWICAKMSSRWIGGNERVVELILSHHPLHTHMLSSSSSISSTSFCHPSSPISPSFSQGSGVQHMAPLPLFLPCFLANLLLLPLLFPSPQQFCPSLNSQSSFYVTSHALSHCPSFSCLLHLHFAVLTQNKKPSKTPKLSTCGGFERLLTVHTVPVMHRGRLRLKHLHVWILWKRCGRPLCPLVFT